MQRIKKRGLEAIAVALLCFLTFSLLSNSQLTVLSISSQAPTIGSSGSIRYPSDSILLVTDSTPEGPIPYTLDGQSGYETGSSYTVELGTYTIELPSPYTSPISSITYHFSNWQDGPTNNPRTIAMEAGTTTSLHALYTTSPDPPEPPPDATYIAYSGFESGNFWEQGGSIGVSFQGSQYNYHAPAGTYPYTTDYVIPKAGSYMFYQPNGGWERQECLFGTGGGDWYWELYWSMWIYFPTDFNLAEGGRWDQFWELREQYTNYAGGADGSLDIWLYQKSSDNADLYWNFYYGRVPKTSLKRIFDFSVDETGGWHGSDDGTNTFMPTTIQYTPHEVPLGRWFRLEIYTYRHTTDGIFKVWITDPQHPDPSKQDTELLFHVWDVQTKADMQYRTDWNGARIETFKLYRYPGTQAWFFDEVYVANYNVRENEVES